MAGRTEQRDDLFHSSGGAELRHGVAILPKGRRQRVLAEAIEDMLEEDFRKLILPFDLAATQAYAAIARAHVSAVATRNTVDYEGCGIEVIDPWLDLIPAPITTSRSLTVAAGIDGSWQ